VPPGPAGDTLTDPYERILFEADGIEIGSFRCRRTDPGFCSAGPIRDHCVFAFPRTAVWIGQQGRRRFASDTGIVTFYNPRQAYSRAPLDSIGDFCEWYAVPPDVAAAIARDLDPAVEGRWERPFRFSHAPVDARAYLAQRQLFESLDSGGWTDILAVEERVIALLGRVLSLAYRACHDESAPPARERVSRQQELAEHVRVVLAAHVGAPLTLRDLARAVGCSPHYLCRAFRKATGSTIHGYREQLRLRAALAALAEGEDLTELSLDLGYSSHSHFTANFRKAFGAPPSLVRSRLTALAPRLRART
jgi:AraC-like DNA-binding protein